MDEFVFLEEKGARSLSLRQIMFVSTVVLLSGLMIFKVYAFFRENAVAEERQVVAKVKAGIDRYYIESVSGSRSPLYPAVLDSAHPGHASEENNLFSNVLVYPGLTEKQWRKVTDHVYQGPSQVFYMYQPLSGEFNEQELVSQAVAKSLKIASPEVNAELISRLRDQNVIIFPDGKKLIGSAVVLIPHLNGSSSLQGQSRSEEIFPYLCGRRVKAEISAQAQGLAGAFEFGYYAVNPVNNKKVMVPLFGAPDKSAVITEASIESAGAVGFYVSPDGAGRVFYYTQSKENPGHQQRIRVYPNDAFAKLTFACELGPDEKDKDFQDLMITVSY